MKTAIQIITFLALLLNFYAFTMLGAKRERVETKERSLYRTMKEQQRLQARILRQFRTTGGQRCLDNLTKAEVLEFYGI